MGVGVTAEAVVGLVQRDVVGAAEQVRGRESRDAGTDDGGCRAGCRGHWIS